MYNYELLGVAEGPASTTEVPARAAAGVLSKLPKLPLD